MDCVAGQALLSMEFSRQEYWRGSPCPSPGDLYDPGIKPESLKSPVLPGGFFTRSATWEAQLESSLPNTLTAKYLRVSSCSVSFFFFFNYLFIFGCAGSLLLPHLFSRCDEWGILCDAQASHCSSLHCCRARVLGNADFSSGDTWAQ